MRLRKDELYVLFAILGILSILFIAAVYFPASMSLSNDAWTMIGINNEIIFSQKLPNVMSSPINYLDTSNEPPALSLLISILSLVTGCDGKESILLFYIVAKFVYLLLIPLLVYQVAKYFWKDNAIYSLLAILFCPVFLIGGISNHILIPFTFIMIIFCFFSYQQKRNFKYLIILALVYIFGIFTHQMTWVYEVVLASLFLFYYFIDSKSILARSFSFILVMSSVFVLFSIQIGYVTGVSGAGVSFREILSLIGHIGPIICLGILIFVITLLKKDFSLFDKKYSFLILIAVIFLSISFFSYERAYMESVILCAIAFAPFIGFIFRKNKTKLSHIILIIAIILSLFVSYHFVIQDISSHNVLVDYADISAIKYLEQQEGSKILSNYDISQILIAKKIALPFISIEIEKYPELENLRGFSRADWWGCEIAEEFIDPDKTSDYYQIMEPSIYVRYDFSPRNEVVKTMRDYDIISKVIPWEKIVVSNGGRNYANSMLDRIYASTGSTEIYSANVFLEKTGTHRQRIRIVEGLGIQQSKSAHYGILEKVLIHLPSIIWTKRGVLGFLPLISIVAILIIAYKFRRYKT